MTSLATSLRSLPKRQAGGPNGAVTNHGPASKAKVAVPAIKGVISLLMFLFWERGSLQLSWKLVLSV